MMIFENGPVVPEDISEAVDFWYNRGFFVIPMNMSGRKKPMIKWKRGAPTPDLATLKSLANQGGGIAIRVPRHMIIIDLDVDKGQSANSPNHKVGLNNLFDLMIDEDPECLATLTAQTPTGGNHLYFSTPILIGDTSAKKIAEGIDTRVGPSGLVVVPPSYGTDFVGNYQFDSEFSHIREIPLFLSRKILESSPGTKDYDYSKIDFGDPTISEETSELGSKILKAACSFIESCPRGTRNDTIYSESFKVYRAVASGLISNQDAHSHLLQSAILRSSISGKGADIDATLSSASRNGLCKPYGQKQVEMFKRKFRLVE